MNPIALESEMDDSVLKRKDMLILAGVMYQLQSLRADVNEIGYQLAILPHITEASLERLESINAYLEIITDLLTKMGEKLDIETPDKRKKPTVQQQYSF